MYRAQSLRPRTAAPNGLRGGRDAVPDGMGTQDATAVRVPTPDSILAGLTAIANGGLVVAVLWHIVIAAAVVAVVAGWRPSQRVARVLLVAPLVSVAAEAFAFDNPFNGTAFGVGAVGLAVLGGL